ncbi:MAG TPA: 2-oxoglutarate dehydrogenase E1 component [Tepidisphaeraceae bacterium]|nr:2-oxoglutarate dehydrogenase E1 component [Tepidisphaeraceae bacterium]
MQSDFVNRANTEYIDQLYQRYQTDPRSIDAQWREFFATMDDAQGRAGGNGAAVASTGGQAVSGARAAVEEPNLHLGVNDLVHAYRELGHFIANLDPLGHNRPNHPLLELSEFNMTKADLDRVVGQGTFLGKTDGTLRDLVEKLHFTYCDTLGVEFMGISDKNQREWLMQRMEPICNKPKFSVEECRFILNQLICAQGFEEYLHAKYPTGKRFSIEGAESLIPMMNVLIEDGASLGVDEFVMGMAHRGRLNTLAHVLGKPYEMILGEFEGHLPENDEGDGDVKYHLGYSHDRITKSGRKAHLALSFNPSHLELVNPVVEGIVRAKQYHLGDTQRGRVVPLLIHGDAAFTGQGIVLETLGLSEMPYWRTGGTIHIIINNQIGFTTMPKQGRFTPYPTDVAKTIQAPIFHVNGDDPEACVHAARLAIAFRQQFHCDVMIDLWCYRKWGHNEVDEPSYTQPLLYKEIAEHRPARDRYAQRLIEEGRLSDAEIERMKAELREKFDRAYAQAKESRPRQTIVTLGGLWKGFQRAGADLSAKTSISPEVVRKVTDGVTRVPSDFNLHPKLKPLLQARREMGEGKTQIDWGMGEALALGSLVLEGTPVRFVGQDAQRGTFSHRHACLHDYETGKKWYPLANMVPDQAPIIFVNTMLSELAVLGFEYGFSSADPRNLVIWEAQFGDFVNGAQPIIDQFIAGAESKWQKMCGLVMLLPHGYEGQGPEHSNGYLERFLQLSAENNLQVVVPSTPAQYFHMLRRQIHRKFRKPLIAMMPKSLLRNRESKLDDFISGSLQLVIDDPTIISRDQVRRVLLCSGKVYFTLNAAREKNNIRDVAIVRVEQLYPYPQKEIQAIISRYHRAQEISWVQEEPKNRGAWTFMDPRLREILPDGRITKYYGREEAASPATGSSKLHQIEEQEIIQHALELSPKKAAEAAPLPTPKQAAERATPVSD